MDYTYQAVDRSEVLECRSDRCVCKYCGGRLRVKEIAFGDLTQGRVELYCGVCDRIEYGVEREIYSSARYFVEEMGFDCFESVESETLARQMSVAKVCEMMSWGVKNLGFLDDKGFRVAVEINENMVGECLILRDSDLV